MSEQDNSLLSGGAVEQVRDLTLAGTRVEFEANCRRFATTPLYEITPREPVPDALGMNTLDSFVEYVKKGDLDYRNKLSNEFVLIESENTVALYTKIYGIFNQRTVLLRSRAIIPHIQIGEWMDPESFIIQLLSRFKHTDDRDEVFDLVGHLEDAKVLTLEDDGAAQAVQIRKGIKSRSKAEVKKVVRLAPFRSFPEVEPVESPFILRFRGGVDGVTPPTVAIFEADGGAWRLDAIKRVKEWLQEKLTDIPVYG